MKQYECFTVFKESLRILELMRYSGIIFGTRGNCVLVGVFEVSMQYNFVSEACRIRVGKSDNLDSCQRRQSDSIRNEIHGVGEN